jgi:hypothetical protein
MFLIDIFAGQVFGEFGVPGHDQDCPPTARFARM